MAIIDKPSDYFNTKLYTGDNTNNRQISLDFSPDFTWIKGRNVGYSHILFDRVRTNANYLLTNATSAEADGSSLLGWTNTGCTTNSFTIDKGSNGSINNSGDTYVAWNWLAGGTAVSNTDGSITSSVSANPTAGFSIVSWTGSGASNTVGHGLNSPVELIIVKNRTDSATDWRIGNSFISGQTMADGNGYYLEFDTGAIGNPGSQTVWGSPPANPTSTVFKVGSNNSNNGSGDAMIAYCFHSVQGYSKFGSYIGNGNADGTFVYTGFKPAWVMIKNVDNSFEEWGIWDSKRDVSNIVTRRLVANISGAENTSDYLDFTSNGFKIRTSANGLNQSGSNLIYMAFAENPFVTSTGVPATAR